MLYIKTISLGDDPRERIAHPSVGEAGRDGILGKIGARVVCSWHTPLEVAIYVYFV